MSRYYQNIMIIIYTRRVWSQIVDRLSEQFLARGLSWKQQETTPGDDEQPDSDQGSDDSGVRRGVMRGEVTIIITILIISIIIIIRVMSCVWEAGLDARRHVSLRGTGPGAAAPWVARCLDNKLWWRRKLLTWNIQLIHELSVESTLTNDGQDEQTRRPSLSVLESWSGSWWWNGIPWMPSSSWLPVNGSLEKISHHLGGQFMNSFFPKPGALCLVPPWGGAGQVSVALPCLLSSLFTTELVIIRIIYPDNCTCSQDMINSTLTEWAVARCHCPTPINTLSQSWYDTNNTWVGSVYYWWVNKCCFRAGKLVGTYSHWLHLRGVFSNCFETSDEGSMYSPSCSILSMTSAELMKYSVLKLFQCFLCLRQGEMKSLEMTWRWIWDMEGTVW